MRCAAAVFPPHFLEHPLKPAKGTPKAEPRRDVHVLNACSDVPLTLGKPLSVLVPSAKRLDLPVPLAPTEASHDLDHLVCYQARVQTKRADGAPLPRPPKGTQLELADQCQASRYVPTARFPTKTASTEATAARAFIDAGPAAARRWKPS